VNDIERTAEISECGLYRWTLGRRWAAGPSVCFVMLNPSTADGERDDPTIRRCMAFAKAWGFSALSVRNLFPYRATDPKQMGKASLAGVDITGGERGTSELRAASAADLVVAAWGANHLWTFGAFKFFYVTEPTPIYCINTTQRGHPVHPLYQKLTTRPAPYMRCDEFAQVEENRGVGDKTEKTAAQDR